MRKHAIDKPLLTRKIMKKMFINDILKTVICLLTKNIHLNLFYFNLSFSNFKINSFCFNLNSHRFILNSRCFILMSSCFNLNSGCNNLRVKWCSIWQYSLLGCIWIVGDVLCECLVCVNEHSDCLDSVNVLYLWQQIVTMLLVTSI